MKAKVNKVTIQIVQDDLLSLEVMALVNATDTNLSLTPEWTEKAGATVISECAYIGWCDVGAAVVTNAGNLSAEKIIHAVGPRWGEGSERGKLANVTRECLRLAEENRLRSVALPPISIGTLGYPVENCAKIMLTQIIDYTFEELKHLRSVTLSISDPQAYKIFGQEFQRQVQELIAGGEGTVKV